MFVCFVLSGDGFCDDKANGNYRDPDNCYGFISCSNKIAYKMNCPANLKYNETTDQCDWPQNVQCSPGTVRLFACLFVVVVVVVVDFFFNKKRLYSISNVHSNLSIRLQIY